MELIFVTGNAEKFASAKAICGKHGFQVRQVVAEIDEIQGEDSERIARDKAQKAFELVGQPVIISDDSWSIPSLNGFPGAYMKSVSQWFTPQNFLDLLQNAEDRSAILRQYLVYQDEKETVLFLKEHRGQIAREPRGPAKNAWLPVITMEADKGRTLAEVAAADGLNDPQRSAEVGDAWEDLLVWLKAKHSKD